MADGAMRLAYSMPLEAFHSGEPERVRSSFVKGYESSPVRIVA